jgi:hypothetical protein
VRITALQVGTISLLLAAGMGLFDLMVKPVFRFSMGGFTIPLWVLLCVYGAIQLWAWNMTERGAVLSDEEVAKWGELLTEITPSLISALESGTPVSEVAAKLEEEHGLPVHVTLRYVIALGQMRTS